MVASIYIVKQLPLQYFDTRNVGIRYLNVLQKYEKKIKEDYYATTRTWNDHHPRFAGKVFFTAGAAELYVGTTDRVYTELDEGTTIRYATMEQGFVPKTKARVLDSFPGKGGMAYYDTKTPRPGIEPRHFSDTITRKYENMIVVDLRRATRIGVETLRSRT